MQKISPLSDDLSADIEAKRTWVRNHYSEDAVGEYNTVEGKLFLLDTILKSNWIEKDETLKFQCLGITLGDVFVQDMNFNWVEVADEDDTNPAIKLPNTTIILFPQTMISKRVEAGEQVDVYQLFSGLKNMVAEILEKKDVRQR